MSLPQPSIEAQAHSERLTQRIKQAIEQHGWISFTEFMHRALYAPGLGYYVSGSRKLGAEGDFITAPEISPTFSECLALQCQQVLNELKAEGSSSRGLTAGSILEFGAGSGRMAADILLTLEQKQSLPEKYFILEVSPDFQERQRHTLQQKCPHLFALVAWLGELPKNFEGVVLANEVLDAMPVHCFEVQEGKFYEKGVSISDEKFVWKTKVDRELGVGAGLVPAQPPCSPDLPDGYSSEICFAIKPWLEALYASIKRGVVLFVDYGFPAHEYYHPDRDQGTLMCHYRHHAHTNPFVYIGLQDITAHVDFTAVAHAADQCGFSVLGYTNQANFLMALGILSNTKSDLLNTQQHYQYAQAIKKLLLPSEMGELFKVIALSKKIEIPLQGFQLRNDVQRL